MLLPIYFSVEHALIIIALIINDIIHIWQKLFSLRASFALHGHNVMIFHHLLFQQAVKFEFSYKTTTPKKGNYQ